MKFKEMCFESIFVALPMACRIKLIYIFKLKLFCKVNGLKSIILVYEALIDLFNVLSLKFMSDDFENNPSHPIVAA